MLKNTEVVCLSGKDLKNLRFVLEYVIDAEEKSYEEYVDQFVGELPEEAYDKQLHNSP